MASLGLLSMKFTALMLMIYMALVKVAVGSLVVGFAGSASTIAYFLLRKDVDGTDINDVYIEEQEEHEEQTTQEDEAKETPSEDPDTSSSEESDLKE